jgi:tetrahydromethanopterin S-methyltransferase subunit G
MSIVKKQEDKSKAKGQLEKVKQYTELTKDELKYMIQLIGRSEFTGKDLQVLYAITAKLQNQLNK